MNSKVAFRARTLDANRALSVLREHELPPEFLENGAPSAPRITQQEITTGMEKEEETEHHLQQALNAQQLHKTAEQTAIPIPEITEVDEDTHRTVYRRPFRLPKSLINSQAFLFESDDAAYDADEEDTAWLAKLEKEMGQQLSVAAYERMIQRLEEGSSAQRLVTLAEARLLVKEEADEKLAEAVYQQWRAKRAHTDSLVPTVLTEKRDGSNSNNPYVAFRRRKEKMQTRKNRKNDELSYERMLKMTLDLRKASLLLELIKRREEAKRELCSLVGSMFERRYAAGDFSGSALRDAEHAAARQRALDERQTGVPMSVMSVADFLKFSAIARSPGTCAALQSYVDRAAAESDRGPPTRKRRFDNLRSAAAEESLPGARRRAWHTRGDSSMWPAADARASRSHAEASLLTDDDEPLDGPRSSADLLRDDLAGRKRRRGLSRFGPKAETPAQQLPTTQQAAPPADRLPPAERSTLLLSHLPAATAWRLEDAQATTAIDRDFTFRRKPGCRYAAPAAPAPSHQVAHRCAADQCQCVRRAAASSSRPQAAGAQRCYSLVCMPTGRHAWRLCYARRRVSRARRVVLDMAPASDNVSLPVGASAARFDHVPVENGQGHLSPSKPVGVALSTIVSDAQRAMCVFCDPVTLQCSAGSLCGTSQPHAVHVETLRQLQEARAPVFVPRSLSSEPQPHMYHALPSQAVNESPSSQLLDLVSLYVGRQQKDPRSDQSRAEPDGDRTAGTQRPTPSSDDVPMLVDATDSADRRSGDAMPLKRMSMAVVDSGSDVNRLAAANGCVLSGGGRVHNGVVPTVGTVSASGAGRERCEPLPLVNGNNNNDATQAASSAPTRLVAIGKRITDSLSGLLNGIAAIPMGANENGKPSAPTLAGSQSQTTSANRGSNSPTTNPTRLLLTGASGANSKQSSTLSSQSSAVSSEADADALISEQVRTPTIST